MPAKKEPNTVMSTVRFSEGMAARMRVRLADYDAEVQAGVMHSKDVTVHMQWVRDGLREWDAYVAECEKRERRERA